MEATRNEGREMGIGKNLEYLRESSNLSQEDVAKALNVTRPYYKQLETEAKDASMAELRAISELFGVRVEDLTGSDLSKNEPQQAVVAETLDKVKYKNLILYLGEVVGARPNVGETVFYKLIYFIETLSYSVRGKTITGEQFYKRQYGPVPVSFQRVTGDMIADNELDRVQGRYYTYMQTKYLPRMEATGFSADEKEIIDAVIGKLGHESATYLSNLSHEDAPWIKAKDREILDLSLISETSSESSKMMARNLVAANS